MSEPTRDPDPTIRELFELYVSLALPKLAARSQVNARFVLEAFVRAFGARRVSQLKPLHVAEWLKDHPQWKSGWTRRRTIATIKRLFNFAWEMEVIDRNPVRFLVESQPDPGRAVTPDEFRTMLRYSQADYRQILWFLRVTGCRPGELRDIQWQHVDMDRKVIVLPFHKSRRKTRKPRVIPLSSVAQKLLAYLWRRTPQGMREHLRALVPNEQATKKLCQMMPSPVRQREDFVFQTTRGQQWTRSAFNLRFFRARRLAGLKKDVRPYGLRHCFATEAIRNGVGLKTVSEIVGHNSTRMTEYYLHLSGDAEHLVEGVEQANTPKPRKGGAA